MLIQNTYYSTFIQWEQENCDSFSVFDVVTTQII